MRYLLVAVPMVVVALSSARGQVPGTNSCDGILSAANDVTVKTTQQQWDNYLFRKHCKQQGESWYFDHEGEVGIPKPVSIGILGTWTSDQQQASQFCKTLSQRNTGTHSEADYVSQVVRRAVVAWERCVELQTRGIQIVPKTTQDHVHVDITRTRDDAILQSIVFTGFVECTVSDNKKTKVYHASPVSLSQAIKTGSAINVDCSRRRALLGAGHTRMPAARLSVNTDRGSMVLEFADEGLYSVGSAISKALAEQSEQFARLRADSEAACANPTKVCRCAGEFSGDTETHVTVCMDMCPDGRIVNFDIPRAIVKDDVPGCSAGAASPVQSRKASNK